MEIKWSKFIIERLKPNDRTVRIYTLCIALIMPIKILYTDFVMWRERMRRKVSTTPQVCMIKKSVWDELKLAIEINEGNGKPFDFIIKTDNSNIDVERRMFALINRAKLAGKSYGYENAKMTTECVWNTYVCELMEINAMWEYVCEKAGKITNYILMTRQGPYYIFTPIYAPASDIEITLDSTYGVKEHAYLYKGHGESVRIEWNPSVQIINILLDVYEDDVYEYYIQ